MNVDSISVSRTVVANSSAVSDIILCRYVLCTAIAFFNVIV